ncbi:RNA polymerase sigma factor [Nonomuraea sp. NPDC050790]|uniref:RNA polymerase sigma factor n=1 Tax=Nonomuraea sp. NPDC050790 TaxID=3364371 RepID=UPI0037AB047A
MTETVERVWREEGARLLATLARRLGDLELAEDVLQDAMVEALEHWPHRLPPNPAGWLATTAWRKAVDRLRRAKAGDEKLARLARTPTGPAPEDSRLELAFACCHPVLTVDQQVALTLRAVCGLSAERIAAGFLVPVPTIGQRLLRAKRRLRERRVPFTLPGPDELADRLDAVLAVVYLVFNEGYLSGPGPEGRTDLAEEALRLGRALELLMPAEPEVAGLVALMELHQARAAARFDAEGALVRLADQDRTRWDKDLADQAVARLDRALAARRPGAYQIQASIAALHARAPSLADTDWRQIRVLYDLLLERSPSPVVVLARAVATRFLYGPAAALAEIEDTADRLDGYHLLHALRSELLEDLGRDQEAVAAAERALSLTTSRPEIILLTRRLARLTGPVSEDG